LWEWKKKWLEIVDSVRSRKPSPYGIAFGDSILSVPNGQDSTSLRFAQDDRLFVYGAARFRRRACDGYRSALLI